MRLGAPVAAVAALAVGVGASPGYVRPDRTDMVAWSPDGRWIAYDLQTAAGTEVRAIRPDGSGDRRLIAPSPTYFGLEWSPDSRRLAATNGVETWIAAVSGGAVRLPVGFGDWSRDGRRFVVYAGRGTAAPTISVVSTRTLRGRTLVGGTDPDWSPTSARIAFSGGAYGRCLRSRIFVIGVDGGRARQVGPDAGSRVYADEAGDQVAPRWSPGARRIAWIETLRRRPPPPEGCARPSFPEPPEFAFARATSGGRVALLGGRAWSLGGGGLAWSPTGRLLAHKFDGRLEIVTPLGARHAETTRYVQSFAWSPKGRFIAYAVSPYTSDGAIYVAEPDLAEEQEVAFGREPTWSPSGRWIAYVRDDDCGRRSSVYVSRPDGTGEQPITPC